MDAARLAQLRAVVARHAELPDDAQAPLHLDSLALVQLVEDLEATFDRVIRATDLTPERFGSLAALAAFLDAGQGP